MPQELPIAIKAISKIQQENQQETIETLVNGTITEMPTASYIRYVEETVVDDTTWQTNVTIKLAHDNTIQIRRSGAADARLTFDLTQPTTTHYRTAAGNLLFDIHTSELTMDIEAGTAHLAYALKTGEETLGTYDFTLAFSRI
ncbi:DUF1934 domain-containing protein [Weissella ceti]|uniref:DUF1934 domain-containing protein n=1 Tax=Weissella ceti TaxID=759620 RepID=UPI001BCC8B1F|nr:DUF1934 domain-containing protein [Weissella ceti]QVK12160.1 DUF1934 domain-containing protein [Weissella ceti]